MFMTFEIAEPVLVIGLGGAGSKLAIELKEVMNTYVEKNTELLIVKAVLIHSAFNN